MIVRVASRMVSAISLGVFCRDAPSTRAIIRSMKVSPGLAVICTTIRSRQHRRAAGDRAAVAAGLADHRRGLAGDRRLVDRGDALDDVAVAGDDLTGLDDDPVAEAQRRCRGPLLGVPSVAQPARHGVACASGAGSSAWALPRPSATASARLAKTTVTHSQTVIEPSRTRSGATTDRTVVRTEPTQTTNMTGLRTQVARVELAQRLRQDREQLRCERTRADGRAGLRRRACVVGVDGHDSASASGPSARDGKKVRPATMRMTTDEQPDEQRACGWACVPAVAGTRLLARRAAPARASTSTIGTKPAEQHRRPPARG